jgi:Coenzyme PQQ synthesis protein D (PqqD)
VGRFTLLLTTALGMVQSLVVKQVIDSARTGPVIGLDEVRADAFLRLARRESLAKIIDDLLPEYEVERSALERNLTQLLNALRNQGIIRIEQPPGQ